MVRMGRLKSIDWWLKHSIEEEEEEAETSSECSSKDAILCEREEGKGLHSASAAAASSSLHNIIHKEETIGKSSNLGSLQKLSPGDQFDWHVLESQCWQTGLSQISTNQIDIPARFESFCDYILTFQPFLLKECFAMIYSCWVELMEGNLGIRGADLKVDAKFHYSMLLENAAPFCHLQVRQIAGPWMDFSVDDFVLLQNLKQQATLVPGIIDFVSKDWFIVKIQKECVLGTQILVHRVCTLVTMKRFYVSLLALPLIHYSLLKQLLDPISYKGQHNSDSECSMISELTLKQLSILSMHLNSSQLLAVASLLKQSQGFLLVQGPPGTGKTTTICGMISALTNTRPWFKILVCAPSNAAVDEIAERLMRHMIDIDGNYYSPETGVIVRVGSKENIRASCQHICLDAISKESVECEIQCSKKDSKKNILKCASVVCSTLSGCGQPIFDELDLKFDILVVDEAAQAIEPEVLVALRRTNGICVLVGDPCQLPATIFQYPCRPYERSIFERLEEAGLSVCMLTEQYRMHPSISHLPSVMFYKGQLMDSDKVSSYNCIYNRSACEGVRSHGYSFKLGNYCFLDVSWGVEQNCKTGMSLENKEESKIVSYIVQAIKKNLKENEKTGIGIITPYESQRGIICKELIRTGIQLNTCEVNTVDSFQGREKDIIILSCVRAGSHKGIGFVSDERRMNVALTRAKHSLIIVGHAQTLEKKSIHWKTLIQDARKRGCYQVLHRKFKPVVKQIPERFSFSRKRIKK